MKPQRKIKFRFWNQMARRFQPSSKYCIDGEGRLVAYDYEVGEYDEPVDFSNTCIIAQQYTGLEDKNGKEIYEGDIVKIDSNVNTEEIFAEIFCNSSGSFLYKRYKYKNNALTRYLDIGRVRNYTIVGNIFENFALLKQHNI